MRRLAPPSAGDVVWTRRPLVSASSIETSPGAMAIFSWTSSFGTTSTRSGMSSMRCSVRVAVTTTFSSSSDSGARSTSTRASAPARTSTCAAPGSKSLFVTTTSTRPGGSCSVTVPSAPVCRVMPPALTAACATGPSLLRTVTVNVPVGCAYAAWTPAHSASARNNVFMRVSLCSRRVRVGAGLSRPLHGAE